MRLGVLGKVDDSIRGTVFVPHSGHRQIEMGCWCHVRAAAEAVVVNRRHRRLRILTLITRYGR